MYCLRAVALAFILAISMAISAPAQESEKATVLQLCQPGEPGYVDWEKKEFVPGDSVWVFYKNDPSLRFDKNGFIFPHCFSHAVRGVVARRVFFGTVFDYFREPGAWEEGPIPGIKKVIVKQSALVYGL